MAKRKYWLMKSEPDVYSIDDLERDGSTYWEGVRNYQARNLMREMEVGDGVLYYHSNQKPPGVVGLARVSKEAYPDPTQFDERSNYYDEKSTKEKPRWDVVDVEFVEKFEREVPLPELRERKDLEGMALLKKGQRLSVQPVTAKEWKTVCRLGGAKKGG
jgi:predicted RNA-binding protein with PUA-like domain